MSFWRKFKFYFLEDGSKISSIEELAKKTENCPEMLSFWLNQNIDWTKDRKPEDEWKNPRITFKEKKGDCEDYALLSKKVLDIWGWKSFILCYYPQGDTPGHAICAYFEKDNKLSYFSNYVFSRTKITTISELVKYLEPEYSSYIIKNK